MGFSEKLKFKYLQTSYRPHKPKPMFGSAKSFFDEIEDFLTPDSEKKNKKESGKDAK